MPRVSLRRAFLYFSAVACASLLLVVVHSPHSTIIPLTGTGGRRSVAYGDHPVMEIIGESGVRKSDGDSKNEDGQQKDSADNELVDEEEIQQRLVVQNVVIPPLPANHTVIPPHERPWFMKDGKRLPEIQSLADRKKLPLWPSESKDDRIPEQLMYRPPPPPPQDVDHPDVGDSEKAPALKKILMYNGMNSWGLKAGRGQFMKLKCPVDTCVLTGSRSDIASADAVVFKDHFSLPHHPRDPQSDLDHVHAGMSAAHTTFQPR